jgi:hypothetical protein
VVHKGSKRFFDPSSGGESAGALDLERRRPDQPGRRRSLPRGDVASRRARDRPRCRSHVRPRSRPRDRLAHRALSLRGGPGLCPPAALAGAEGGPPSGAVAPRPKTAPSWPVHDHGHAGQTRHHAGDIEAIGHDPVHSPAQQRRSSYRIRCRTARLNESLAGAFHVVTTASHELPRLDGPRRPTLSKSRPDATATRDSRYVFPPVEWPVARASRSAPAPLNRSRSTPPWIPFTCPPCECCQIVHVTHMEGMAGSAASV